MPNFVWDNTALPADKSNATAIPSSADPNTYFQGSDWNAIKTAIQDARTTVWKGGGRTAPAAVAPTTGTYEVGDIVFNSVPAVGSNIGWVCVNAGTPGLWKEFGVIADDVINGSVGGSSSDITDSLRLIGSNKATHEFYPDTLGGGRKAAIGFIAASDVIFKVTNEQPAGGDILLTPGSGAKVDVASGFKLRSTTGVQTDQLEKVGANFDLNVGAAPRMVGVTDFIFALFPEGTGAGRKGFIGFEAAAPATLAMKNEKAANGHVKLTAGTGANVELLAGLDVTLTGQGAGKVVLQPGATGTVRVGSPTAAGIKAINVFTTTWDPPSLGSGSDDIATFTVTGVALGDVVLWNMNPAPADKYFIVADVSAANTVRLFFKNESSGTIDPASGTLTLLWFDLT